MNGVYLFDTFWVSCWAAALAFSSFPSKFKNPSNNPLLCEFALMRPGSEQHYIVLFHILLIRGDHPLTVCFLYWFFACLSISLFIISLRFFFFIDFCLPLFLLFTGIRSFVGLFVQLTITSIAQKLSVVPGRRALALTLALTLPRHMEQ